MSHIRVSVQDPDAPPQPSRPVVETVTTNSCRDEYQQRPAGSTAAEQEGVYSDGEDQGAQQWVEMSLKDEDDGPTGRRRTDRGGEGSTTEEEATTPNPAADDRGKRTTNGPPNTVAKKTSSSIKKDEFLKNKPMALIMAILALVALILVIVIVIALTIGSDSTATSTEVRGGGLDDDFSQGILSFKKNSNRTDVMDVGGAIYDGAGWEQACPLVADTTITNLFDPKRYASSVHTARSRPTFGHSPVRRWVNHYVNLILDYGPRVPHTVGDTSSEGDGWDKAFSLFRSMARCQGLKNLTADSTVGRYWDSFWTLTLDGPFSENIVAVNTDGTHSGIKFTKTFTNIVVKFTPTLVTKASGRSGLTQETTVVNAVRKGHVVLAAHFDSKWFENSQTPFLGASDSVVPCVMVLELMRRLATKAAEQILLKAGQDSFSSTTTSSAAGFKEMPEVTVMLFDGEEAFFNWRYPDHTYGSRHLAEEWAQEGLIPNITTFILLDLIAPAKPTFSNFYAGTSSSYMKLKTIEKNRTDQGLNMGSTSHTYFHEGATATDKSSSIQDDHTPWIKRGLRNVLHLIASPFPATWHRSTDNAQSVSYNTVEDLTEILWTYLDEL